MHSIVPILPNLPRLKIVDVGAAATNDGPAYGALLKSFSCDVVGFEPDSEACGTLNARAEPCHLYLPHAIADGTKRTFYECRAPECSSLFEPDAVLAEKFQSLGAPLRLMASRLIDTKRLDDVPEAAGADFLKIDVQGAALLVLEGAIASLRDVLVVHTEVEFLPLYKGQALFADIDRFLRSQGFAFHSMRPFGRAFLPTIVGKDPHAFVNQLIWADAVYVRDFMGFAALPPLALLKIAAILHENYRSYDLAALALEHYDKHAGTALQSHYFRLLAGH